MRTEDLQIKRDLYKPWRYFVLYILITISISFFGPREYANYDKLSVFLYMTSFLILFSIGYHRGIIAPVHSEGTMQDAAKFSNIMFLLKICIILSILTVMFHFLTALFAGKISLSLYDIGQNYINDYLDRRATGSTSASAVINFLSGFPRLVTMVLGVYYFRNLRISYKFAVIATLALWVLTNTLSYGNQKATGDIVIYLLVVSAIKMLDLSPIKRKTLLIQLTGLLVIFGAFISLIQHQRLTASGITLSSIDLRMNSLSWFDWNHPIFHVLGQEAGLAVSIFITSYLAGGYYGLSLCLQLPFVWTYGIGSSFSLMVFLERFMGFQSILDSTYLLRLEHETGWNGLMAWNTIFPWLASDFTFVGALIIFIPIAYVYAVSWKEIVEYRNPISILMFSMLTMGLIFLPANNQLLHGYDGFITTTIMIVLWVRMHKRYNIIF